MNTRYLIVLVLILLVLTGAGIGYLYYIQNNEDAYNTNNNNTTNNTTTTTNSTYTNNSGDYSFQYPNTWAILETEPPLFSDSAPGTEAYEMGLMFSDCDVYLQSKDEPSSIVAVEKIDTTGSTSCSTYGDFTEEAYIRGRFIESEDEETQILVSKWKPADTADYTYEWDGKLFQSQCIDDICIYLVIEEGDKNAEIAFDNMLRSLAK